MPWKLTSIPANDSSLPSPYTTSTQQMPRTFYRTLRYLLLLLCLLISAYTLSFIPFSAPFPQSSLLPTNSTFPSTLGKVTASFGPRVPVYDAAIASHRLHNERFGYPHFILRQRMLPGLWTKHACLFTVIGSELAKPEGQRLEWLFWHDRDVVLMNPNIPLDVFLPPSDGSGEGGHGGFEHINAIVTRDRNGLNNGVFFVRVSEWSLKMFASALSVREYERGVELKYSEQSGMERVIERVRISSLHPPSPLPRFSNPHPLIPFYLVLVTDVRRVCIAMVEFFNRLRSSTMVQWLSSCLQL